MAIKNSWKLQKPATEVNYGGGGGSWGGDKDSGQPCSGTGETARRRGNYDDGPDSVNKGKPNWLGTYLGNSVVSLPWSQKGGIEGGC